MLKTFILVTFLSVSGGSNIKAMMKEGWLTEEAICRVTCTINIPDGLGGSIGISASAGGIFTDCETAGERACRKVLDNINSILQDMK